MTAVQVAETLGVRPATVYAYVSRGVLRRTTTVTEEGQRISLFDRSEVLALATQRSRPRAGIINTLIESDVTEVDPRGRLAFRGVDVTELVGRGFEEAVGVLWEEQAPWAPLDSEFATAVDAGLPAGVTDPRDRILLAVAHAATADPSRSALTREHVLFATRSAIQSAVRALGGTGGRPIATDLWTAFTGTAPNPEQYAAIDAALVVLMDHELAASTLAARVAAGTHADPWMSLLAGLAVLRGPRHGGASGPAVVLLRRWLADHTVAEQLEGGFGHKVYEGIDPRGEILLERVSALDPELSAEVDDLVIAVARDHSVLPNVDLGLAALTLACRLPDAAGECLFMVSRMAGFGAHVLEEYPHGLRYRPRAVTSR